jgi:predicted nuclease of predicted toxin-antitoxin system
MNLFAAIYLDEDVNPLIARLLGNRGFDVTTVHDAGLSASPDPQQLAFAASQHRCIVTHNRLDYEMLHQEYLASARTHAGIVLQSEEALMSLRRGWGYSLIG